MEQNPTAEEVQARHRRELKDLQGRITSKKKNANKKTRKGVNDECAAMERDLKEKQAAELAVLSAEEGPLDMPAEDAEEKIEKAVEKLHLGGGSSGDASNGNGLSPQSSQQGAGQKRNRQKERMARRAAEQEEATLRAEQEASTMTDHRAQESASIQKTITSNSLTEHPIAPDGHCLFSAVADQLSQNSIPLTSHGEPAYKTVRRDAAGYMLDHRDDFAPFLEEEIEGYAERMKSTAEWGGQLELMALARRYGVEIRVVQDGRVEKIGEEEGLKEKGTGKVLWLAYYRHGYGLGEHYNSLRKSEKA
ncbi:OTU-domain-containing protein [Sarocladium strictum]